MKFASQLNSPPLFFWFIDQSVHNMMRSKTFSCVFILQSREQRVNCLTSEV